jgi:hypothetical protein
MAKCRVPAILALCLPLLLSVSAGSVHSLTPVGEFTTVKVKSVGISLWYPSNWTVLTLTPKDVLAQRKRLVKTHPESLPAFDAAVKAVRGTGAFRATDVDAKFAERVYVGLTGDYPSTLKKFTSDVRATVYTSHGLPRGELVKASATILSSSTVKVSGRTGYRVDSRLSYNDSDGSPVTELSGELVVLRSTGNAQVSVTTPDDAAGATLIDNMLRSVHSL